MKKFVLHFILVGTLYSSSVFAENLRCEWAFYDQNQKPTEPHDKYAKIIFPKYHSATIKDSEIDLCAEHAGRGLLEVKAASVYYGVESTNADEPTILGEGGGYLTYFQAYVAYAHVKSRLPKPKKQN